LHFSSVDCFTCNIRLAILSHAVIFQMWQKDTERDNMISKLQRYSSTQEVKLVQNT
jgi:hypothetical protein